MTAFVALLSLTMGTATDTLTADEQLYLSILVKHRETATDATKRDIKTCEDEIERRKHEPKSRSARRAASENHSDDILSGNSRTRFTPPHKTIRFENRDFGKVGPHTTREELQSKLDFMKSTLESLETGMKPHGDPEWDPQYNSTYGALSGDIRVLQVIDPSDMLVSAEKRGILWISGYSTKNLVDNQPVKLGGLFLADGTKTYTNTVGVKSTVRLLRPFVIDRDKVIAEFQAQSKASATPAREARHKPIREAEVASIPTDPEEAAKKRFAGVLANARKLAKAGLREAAEKNLQRIIKEAPSTAIAKEAQQELDQLHNGG